MGYKDGGLPYGPIRYNMRKIAIIEKEKQLKLNSVFSGHMSYRIVASVYPTEKNRRERHRYKENIINISS